MSKTQKLNTEMPDLDAAMKALQSLNLTDDFLFDVTTVDLENCKIIIELSLGIVIREIRWREGQKVVHNLPGRRGIRMDFYVEDMDGNIFIVEMQKRNEGNIPKRMRFYQAVLDAPMLSSGEKFFDNLHPTYIIVICDFDLYKRGLYRYTFENTCKEIPGLPMGDGCSKIFLNTKGSHSNGVEQPLIDFLHFVRESNGNALPANCDKRLRHLQENIRRIKSDKQMGVAYMTAEERDRLLREEGKQLGIETGILLSKIQIIIKKSQKGKSLEQIADELEESADSIFPFYQAVMQCAPDYDIEKIFSLLQQKDEA